MGKQGSYKPWPPIEGLQEKSAPREHIGWCCSRSVALAGKSQDVHGWCELAGKGVQTPAPLWWLGEVSAGCLIPTVWWPLSPDEDGSNIIACVTSGGGSTFSELCIILESSWIPHLCSFLEAVASLWEDHSSFPIQRTPLDPGFRNPRSFVSCW